MRHLLFPLVVLLVCLPSFAQDNPVTNGSFESVNQLGEAQDWEFMGAVKVVDQPHSGQRGLLLERTAKDKGETGLNRRWKIDSGEQGAMLSQLRGGLEFWYKALAAEPGARLTVGLIAMTSVPKEGTGEPRVMYEVPVSQVGDGQWHRGLIKYDFSGNELAKWVHVSSRISGAPGKLLLDDIKWVASVGPLSQVGHLTLTETPGQEGESCTVRAQVKNIGDAPLQKAQATLTVPGYLQVTGGAAREVPALEPDGVCHLQWQVTGLRDRADTLGVQVKAGEQVAEDKLALATDVQVEQLQAERFLLAPGETTKLRLVVVNTGNAAAKGLLGRLVDTGAARQAVAERGERRIDLVRPGKSTTVEWTASLKQIAPAVRVEAELLQGAETVGKAAVELVCAPPMPAVPAVGAGAYAKVWPQGAVVGNETVRLVFAMPLPSPGWLQVKKEAQWQTVGVLPNLGAVATAPASEGEGLRVLEPMKVLASEKPDGAALSLESGAFGAAGGQRYYAMWTLRCRAGTDTVDYEMTLGTEKDGELYGLHGPMLYVGEGSWGGKKTEAVFPGLEWLVRDEVSSSTLDISPLLMERWRWCPPAHAVTIPAMSVYHDGITVGLLWDHLQKTGGLTRPRAVFGAPDRFEGRNACLLGLMAPGGADPEWWVAPRRATEQPWPVKPGQPLRLTAQLYAKAGTTDALTAMDRWFAIHGAPKPERLPHGRDWEDEIAFSARGYLDSLWDPKTQKWFASLNGPQQMMGLGWHPQYLYDVVYASRLSPDPDIKRRCIERAAEVQRLSGGQAPAAEDMAFEFGKPVARLIGQGDVAAGLIKSQGADGAWRFRARIEKSGIFAGRDYGELGPDQAAEVGTCAANAYSLLRYARMTGDPQATAAGLKALEFMKQFTVPRAAQVWEVPVHTPDVLASADACEAYLEAYQITGDKQYLQQAVFWARTGLPFCYVWDTPGYESLRYASIPVFGASWYTCNWFGRPVQWNGLRLARAYTKLQAHDQSYPWATIAEGLTVSCMWQQHGAQTGGTDIWPDHNEKWTALWPDNFDSVSLKRCPWVFAPRQILDLVYRFMGFQPEPQTAVISAQAPRITACAAISEARFAGGKLSAVLQSTPPQTSQVIVCNASRPAAVTVNGAALPEVAKLADVAGPGWEYLPSYKLLLIKPGEAAKARLEVSGVRYEQGRLVAPTVTRLDFNFEADSEGWRMAHDLGEAAVREGVLHLAVTGSDPYLVRSNLDLAPDTVKTIALRLAVPPESRGDLQVFWTTSESPDFAEARSTRAPLVADGQFHEVTVKVGDNPQWAGKRVTGLRLDPGGGPAGVEVRVDYVKAGQ
ncbi:MAG: hypothetical protein ABFD96_19640 [Armatimonadia bacterium]